MIGPPNKPTVGVSGAPCTNAPCKILLVLDSLYSELPIRFVASTRALIESPWTKLKGLATRIDIGIAHNLLLITVSSLAALQYVGSIVQLASLA